MCIFYTCRTTYVIQMNILYMYYICRICVLHMYQSYMEYTCISINVIHLETPHRTWLEVWLWDERGKPALYIEVLISWISIFLMIEWCVRADFMSWDRNNITQDRKSIVFLLGSPIRGVLLHIPINHLCSLLCNGFPKFLF